MPSIPLTMPLCSRRRFRTVAILATAWMARRLARRPSRRLADQLACSQALGFVLQSNVHLHWRRPTQPTKQARALPSHGTRPAEHAESSHAGLAHTFNQNADCDCDDGHTVNATADGENTFLLKCHVTGEYYTETLATCMPVECGAIKVPPDIKQVKMGLRSCPSWSLASRPPSNACQVTL